MSIICSENGLLVCFHSLLELAQSVQKPGRLRRREMNEQRSRSHECQRARECGELGSGDLRSGRLGRDRLVKVATVLGENPSVSLPRSMRNWVETQGPTDFWATRRSPMSKS